MKDMKSMKDEDVQDQNAFAPGAQDGLDLTGRWLTASGIPTPDGAVRAWLDRLGVPVPVGIRTLMDEVRRAVIAAGDAGYTAGRQRAAEDLTAHGPDAFAPGAHECRHCGCRVWRFQVGALSGSADRLGRTTCSPGRLHEPENAIVHREVEVSVYVLSQDD